MQSDYEHTVTLKSALYAAVVVILVKKCSKRACFPLLLLLGAALVLKQKGKEVKQACSVAVLRLLRYGICYSRALDPSVTISLQWQTDTLWPVIVLDDVRASDWLRELVNRYMHGLIPTKVESCAIQRFTLHLSNLSATLTGLVILGRRTHEDEWDEARFYDKVVKNRRWAADFTQGLIEKAARARQRTTAGSSPEEPPVRFNKWWAWMADAAVRRLAFDARDVHLR
jgi:hypothetical protein